MSEISMYSMEFSEEDMASLSECLSELRMYIQREYNQLPPDKQASDDRLFIAASILQCRVEKITSPNTRLTLRDYLEYGNK